MVSLTVFYEFFFTPSLIDSGDSGELGDSGESCDSGETELVNLVKRAFQVKSCKLGRSDSQKR